jgi:hypothetical protein
LRGSWLPWDERTAAGEAGMTNLPPNSAPAATCAQPTPSPATVPDYARTGTEKLSRGLLGQAHVRLGPGMLPRVRIYERTDFGPVLLFADR